MSKAVSFLSEQPLSFPQICRSKMLLRLLVLTQAVAILLAFAPGHSTDPWLRLGVISLCSHWVTLLSLGLICPVLQRLPLLRLSHFILLVTAVLFVVTTAISVFVWVYFTAALYHYGHFVVFLGANLLLAAVVGLLLIQLLVMHAERAALLVAQQKAQLDALQARIEPHFLFNSLNAIAELIHQAPNAAEQSLLDLAALFRAAMHAGKVIPLSQELELAQKYLKLETIRLGKKIQLDWDVPERYPDIAIPALTLQPLLENAVRYGVEPSTEVVVISVQLLVTTQQLVLLLANPLHQFNATSAQQQNGLALDNIRNRLTLLYAERQHFSVSAKDGTFRVKIVLPLKP